MFLRAITLAAIAAALPALPATAQSQRYSGGWQQSAPAAAPAAKPAKPELRGLLRELDDITAQAEREKAAHPRLLSDMRALVGKYARRWPQPVLSDVFRDGDLSRNPRWIVESGAVSVGSLGLMLGQGAGPAVAATPAPAPAPADTAPPPAEEDRRENVGAAIFSTLLEELARERAREGGTAQSPAAEPAPPQPAPAAQPAPMAQPATIAEDARIRTEAAVPNAFVLRVALRSRAGPGGGFEMGVGQGAGALGYRLRYRPAESPSLSLLRIGASGVTVIESAAEAVRLEDDRRHRLELARDLVGGMTVAVDGRQLLELRDRTFRDDFDRVVLIGRGGEYAVRGVAVYGAP